MSYYIAPRSTLFQEMNVFAVKDRLSDYNAKDDQEYVVFKSRKQMRGPKIAIYKGVKGKLKKSHYEVQLFPGHFVRL